MRKLRLGFVGCGDMGRSHILGFMMFTDEIDITAIAEPDEKSRNLLIKKTPSEKFKFYNDYKKMIENEELDAVVISVPDYLHYEVAKYCLLKNLDIFLEKPVTVNLNEAIELKNLASEKKRIVQVGLVYRYSTLYRLFEKYVNFDEFGKISLIWCKEFRQPFPQIDWFYDKNKTGGTLVEKNCHHFDLFNRFVKSKPLSVFAYGGQNVWNENKFIECSYCPFPPKKIDKITIIDHAFVIVKYENGAKACLGLCMHLHSKAEAGLEVGAIGTGGKQILALKDKILKLYGFSKEVPYEEKIIDSYEDNRYFGHIGSYAQRKAFIESVKNRKEPYASLDVGIKSIVVAMAAEKSIEENREVFIEELYSWK